MMSIHSMRRSTLRLTLAAGLTLAATPGLADEPGPGGTKPVVSVTGEEVYRNVCQACHMADARGASGAATIPALAGNRTLEAAGYPILLIAKGRGAMPALGEMLNAKQIAAVATYIRTHFGNNYTQPVTEAEVKEISGTR